MDRMDKTSIVTWLINPNHFYIYVPKLQMETDSEEQRMKQEIASTLKIINYYIPKKNDCVAFFFEEKQKYIRCVIDDILILNNIVYFILFALDYGVPFYTTKQTELIELSDIYKFQPSPVIGPLSLEILPARSEFNFITNENELIYTQEWSDLINQKFHYYMEMADTIAFEPSNIMHKNFVLGDVILTYGCDIKHSLTELLLYDKLGKKPESFEDFQYYYRMTKTPYIERWNNNSRTGGILKTKEGTLPLQYDVEIAIKEKKREEMEKLVNVTTMCSIEKVLDWKQKISGYEQDLPEPIEFDPKCDDEGFIETKRVGRKPKFAMLPDCQSNKRKYKFKKYESATAKEDSSISEVFESVSQVEAWTS